VFVRVVHYVRYLRHEFYRLPDGDCGMPNDFVKLPAFNEFHAEIARPIAFAYFVNGNNARMIEPRCGFRFPTETLHVRFAGPLAKVDDFQRDSAVKTFLASSKYNALTTTPDLL
jgi:hypothetical protein